MSDFGSTEAKLLHIPKDILKMATMGSQSTYLGDSMNSMRARLAELKATPAASTESIARFQTPVRSEGHWLMNPDLNITPSTTSSTVSTRVAPKFREMKFSTPTERSWEGIHRRSGGAMERQMGQVNPAFSGTPARYSKRELELAHAS